jgi:hypothetical protein
MSRLAASPRGRDLPGLLALGCLLAVAGVVVWLAGRPLATDDTWYHLKLGELYAQQGPWVDSDPMLFTSRDQPTVPQEWLFQLALYGLERATGFYGLRAVHALAAAAILGLVYACFLRAGGSRAAAALATALFACVAWFRLFQLRADLVSIPATLALYSLLLAGERPASPRRVAGALVLLLVWVNAHSLFAIGLALILAALLGIGLEAVLGRGLRPPHSASDAVARAVPLAAAFVLGALVTLANPRGAEQHATFFAESASGDIWVLEDEFRHFDPFAPVSGNLGLTPLAWLATDAILAGLLIAVAHGIVRLARERSREALRDLDPVHLGLAAAGAVAMLVAIRFLFFSIFPLLYLLRWQRRGLARRPAARARSDWLAAGLSGAVLVAFPGAIHLDAFAREVASERSGYWRSRWLDERYCGAGMRFLRDAGLRGNLFQPFNLGGFLGYWLSPALGTFIDGRLDQIPSDALRDYLRLRVAPRRDVADAMREILDKWRIEVFVGLNFPEERFSDASWLPALRRSPDWIGVFAAEHCAVYLRRAEGAEENLRRVRDYYAGRGLPFDPERGLDASELIRSRPGWARRQGILPEDYRALAAARRRPDPELRAAALERLGQLYWRIGAFREGVEVERELLALRPASRDARYRLADSLLLLGRPAEALEVAEALHREAPDHADVSVIRDLARARRRLSAPAGTTGS